MKLLITGAAGFIGSHFADLMVGECEVAALDGLTYAGDKANVPIEARFYHVNLLDSQAVLNALQDFEPTHIVHLAAETHVMRSIDHPHQFIDTNIIGTYNLLEAIRQCPQLTRFVYVSTDEVYGSRSNNRLFHEGSPLNCGNPYSASKAAAEQLCLAYHNTFGIPVTVARPCNNYGPRQYVEKFIPHCINQVLTGKAMTVHGDGIQERQWLYVTDTANALQLILEEGETGKLYNIGSAYIHTNKYVAKQIQSHLGGGIVHISDRPGNDRRYGVSCEPLLAMGWKQYVSFDDGIQKTIDHAISMLANAA